MDIYQAMALDLYKFGKLPYIGSWDSNFPGPILTHLLGIVLFGNSDLGYRIVMLGVHLLTCYFLYRLVTRWFTVQAAAIAVVVYAFYHIGPPYWLNGQRDALATLFLTASACLLTGSFYKRSKEFWAGVLLGAAFLVRPTYGIFLPFYWWLAVIWAKKQEDAEIKIIPAIVRLTIGWLLIPLAFVALYTRQDNLQQLYYAVVGFNLDVYSTYHLAPPIEQFLQEPLLYLMLLLPIMLLLRKKKITGQGLALAIAFIICALATPFTTQRFYNQHFESFLTILIVLGSASLWTIIAGKRAGWKQFAFLLVVLIAWRSAYYPRHIVSYFVNAAEEHPSYALEDVYARIASDPASGIPVQDKIANYVKTHTYPTDKIALLSMMARIHWKAERESATRFTWALPLVMHPNGQSFTRYQLQWQREFLRELTSQKPVYIIQDLQPTTYDAMLHTTVPAAFSAINGLDALLSKYRLEATLGSFRVFRRIDL